MLTCLYLRAVVLTLTFCPKSDLSLWRWMNKCQSPVAQQSTRFLHCVTGSARKDNSTFGIVWNLCQIATWKYYGWAHIFFRPNTILVFFLTGTYIMKVPILQRDKYPQSCIPFAQSQLGHCLLAVKVPIKYSQSCTTRLSARETNQARWM